MKGNVIQMNTLHLNSVRLNGIGKVQSVSLKGGSTEDPVFPPVEPPVEPEPTPTYTLSASVANGVVSATLNGVVISLPFTANEGDVIVLSVTPNDGYAFEGWNDGNTDNPRTIVVNEDITLNASCKEVFVPLPTYTLSASVVNGVISATLNGKAISLPYEANEGDVIVVSVEPNEGFSFEGWADGNTDNPRTITMNADVALSAQCVEVVVPSKYIQFEDAEVERVLMSKGVSSDGVGITMEDAAAVTSISTWFKGNTAITSFDELKYFTGVTAIPYAAFDSAINLNSLDMSNIVTIGDYGLKKTNLNTIIAPRLQEIGIRALEASGVSKILNLGTLTSLPDRTFLNCDKLEVVILPNTLETIGTYAFSDIAASITMVSKASIPPTLTTTFTNSTITAIYVPDASVEAYKGATNWSSYASRIKGISQLATDNPTLYAEIQQYL